MKELILLRHAKAMQAAPDGSDRERPLSEQGEAAAAAVGQWLAEHGAAPDHILCSTARRCMMTLERASAQLAQAPVHFEAGIYDATPGELIALIDRHPQANQTLLLGHNPGIERLLALLTSGQSGSYRGIPPAGLAWLRFSGAIEPGMGTVHAFWSQ